MGFAVTDSLFPPEIIIEILSWLPVEYHGGLMLVCKQWYALIQDRHFMEKHMSRAPKLYNYYYIPNVLTEPEEYNHVYACDGLYLQKHRVTNKYRIHNPTTKQVLELPDPQKGSHGIVFSYVPCTRNYKFVSVFDESNTECCEVFSVEHDEFCWRTLNLPSRDFCNGKKKKISVVSTGDAVHCVRVVESGVVMVEEVVSLDLGTEQFFVTKIPKGEYKSWRKVWALNFMGKLALVDRMEEDVCILVLEDYKKQKWGKRKPLIPSASMKILEDEHGTVVPCCFHEPDMLRLWVKDRMFISVNMRNRVEEKTERLGKEGHKLVEVLYPVQHSLVSDPAHSGVLKFLFVRSFEPYSEFIRPWIYKAKFSDPYNEFIVEYPDSLLHYKVGSTGVSADFALATIREQDSLVPCFLKENISSAI